MAHAQKTYFVFRRNGRVHLNRQGRQFSRLLTAEVCATAIVMLDAPCSEVVWMVLATHSIRQFPLHFLSHASPCAITFQMDSTKGWSFTGASSVLRTCFSRVTCELHSCLAVFTRYVRSDTHYCLLWKEGNQLYRGADKSLARPGRKQATATEDFDIHISYV